MPKIPTYTARGQITTETPSVQTTIQAPIPTVAGEIQSALAKYYIAEKQEEAKIKSAEYENESWNELYNIFDKHKNNPYPTDATNNFQRDTEAYKQNFLNTRLAGESKFTRDAWLQKFESNKSSTLLALNKTARNNLENKNQEQFQTFASSMSTRIMLDPSFSAKAILEIDNEVNKIEDKFVREEKRKFLINVKDATILDMMSNNNPAELLQQLKENPELYSNIPEEKATAIKFAMNKVSENQEKLFNDNINKLVANTPYGQQADTSALMENQIKELFPNEKDYTKAINLANSLFQQKREKIQKEGAGQYFIDNDPFIKNLYNQSLTDPTRFKTFVQSLDEVFNKQKIPKDLRTYLPNNKIQEIKDIIDKTPGSKERLQVVDNLKSLYGDAMPIINKQIFDKVGEGVSIAISSNDIDVRSLSILGEVSDDNKRLLNARFDPQETNIQGKLLKKIESNLSSLQNIISNQPEGFKRNSSYVAKLTTGLKNAAMNGLLDNKYSSTSEAADKISQGYLNDYVLTNDTFYIPTDVNGKPVAQDIIEAKAKIFETKLYFNNIDLTNFDVQLIGEGGKPISKQETIDTFKKNGEWYMDGNVGLKYGIKEASGRFQPMKINGENVTINFLDYDGEFKSIKDKFGNSYIMDMKDIYNFISAEFEGAETP